MSNAIDDGATATEVPASTDTPEPTNTPEASAAPEPTPAPEPAAAADEPPSRRRRGELDMEAIAEAAAKKRDADMVEAGHKPADTREADPDPDSAQPAPAAAAPEPAADTPAPEPEAFTPDELAQIGKRKVALTIDGHAETRSLEQILRDAQKAGAADRRLQEATALLAQARETVTRVEPAPADDPPDQAIEDQVTSVIDAFFSGDEDAAKERLTALLARRQSNQTPAIDTQQVVQQVKQSLDDESALQAVLAEYPQVNLNSFTQQAADTFFNAALAEGKSRQEAFRTAAEQTYEAFGYTPQTPAARPPATAHASQTHERKARLDVPVGRNVSAAKVEQVPVESSAAARSQAVAEIAQRGRPIRGR